MLNRELLIHNLNVRQAAIKHLIDRDITANILEVLAQWREIKWIKEAILRGEYDLKLTSISDIYHSKNNK